MTPENVVAGLDWETSLLSIGFHCGIEHRAINFVRENIGGSVGPIIVGRYANANHLTDKFFCSGRSFYNVDEAVYPESGCFADSGDLLDGSAGERDEWRHWDACSMKLRN